VPESGDATSDHLSVEVLDSELCPRFVGRWVDGITVGPSPLWVQLRLSAAGLRPVSNVVDASNYVMLEMGKPIHAFDAAAVAEGRIIVRRAQPGERIETLDHVERELHPETLLIADPAGPIGIAGVMGGAGSEVSASTMAVVIESAVFDPTSIRRTANRYGLRSEASLRFEKGQESRLARVGADRTAQLICAWAGARAARGVVDTDPVDEPVRRVAFRPARVSRLLGEPIASLEMRGLLERIGIVTEAAQPADRIAVIGGDEPLEVSAAAGDEVWLALVPSHRRDIAIEADVAEEICRLRGYESLAPRLPDTPMPRYRREPRVFLDHLRETLAGRGLSEVVAHALIAPRDHALLGYVADDPATIRLSNPVTVDHSELRRSLLPGLVDVLLRNERQRRDDVAIFEIGAVHALVDGMPEQAEHVGLLLAGSLQPASWAAAARPADLAAAKGLVDWLVTRLGRGTARVEFGPTDVVAGVEHPGRTAQVELVTDAESAGEAQPTDESVTAGAARTVIGRVGELDPRYLAAYDARAEQVAFAVLELNALRRLAERPQPATVMPHLPAIERDLAVVVSEDTPAARVAETIRAATDRLAELILFDRYQGPPLAGDEISLAYRLRFQATDRALSDEEIELIMRGVIAELESRLGAQVRGNPGAG